MIAVVGGTGFLGSAICAELENQELCFRAFSRSGPEEGKVEWENGEFERASVDSLIKDPSLLEGVETVVYVVSSSIPSDGIDEVPKRLQNDTARELEFFVHCAKQKGIRFVFASSGGTVYGVPEETPIPEEAPLAPINGYGFSKLLMERYLLMLHREFNFNPAILRIANVYGPGQPLRAEQGVIPNLLKSASSGEDFRLVGSADNTRDFIFVTDVARAFVAVIRSGVLTENVFNVGSGLGSSIGELIRAVGKVTGNELSIREEEARHCDVNSNVLDCSRIEREIGWSPEVSLFEGLEQTWRWWQDRNG